VVREVGAVSVGRDIVHPHVLRILPGDDLDGVVEVSLLDPVADGVLLRRLLPWEPPLSGLLRVLRIVYIEDHEDFSDKPLILRPEVEIVSVGIEVEVVRPARVGITPTDRIRNGGFPAGEKLGARTVGDVVELDAVVIGLDVGPAAPPLLIDRENVGGVGEVVGVRVPAAVPARGGLTSVKDVGIKEKSNFSIPACRDMGFQERHAALKPISPRIINHQPEARGHGLYFFKIYAKHRLKGGSCHAGSSTFVTRVARALSRSD